MNLREKVLVITGATSGIGYSLAKLLPKENCSLALIARSENILDDLITRLQFDKAKAYKCDVGKPDDVKNTFGKIKKDFNKIDIAILNAGVSQRADIKNFSSASAKEIFNTNVLGVVNCIEQLLPDFIADRKGMIVGVSSLSDARGFPRSGFYSASKSAVSFLMESLRVELKPFGIKVLNVKPGFVKTPMTDKNEFHMPFLMDVDKASRIIIDGIKKEKKIIQFPLPIVLGSKLLKIMPDFLFDYLMSRKLPPRKK
jgi:short-subunit dehydrogenase